MNLSVHIKSIKQGTNVNDIHVPAQLRLRRQTGLAWFDNALTGEGMVPSSVMMLTGMPGLGKSTLLRQLADSITSQGHNCLYNSTEESLYQVAMACERLRLKSGFLVGQETKLTSLLEYADSVRKPPSKRTTFLLVDSINTLDDGHYRDGGITAGTASRCVDALTNWAKSTYSIVIFIAQSTKNGDFAGKNSIRHAIDVHGSIAIDNDKKSSSYKERIFDISKNRYGFAGTSNVIRMGEAGLVMHADAVEEAPLSEMKIIDDEETSDQAAE